MAEIIVALDVPTTAQALGLVDALPGLRWVKVGPTLFVEGGPALIQSLKERSLKVFLDLKWHDIPHQVAGAAAAAAKAGIDLATVHTLGGSEMMRAAASSAGAMRVVGVTVLTSHTLASYGQAVGRSNVPDFAAEVGRLAREAMASGLAGVVASSQELATIRGIVAPGGWIVVPGIRPAGAAKGDQQRTADAETAVRDGATHLVVGRPITQAREPAVVYEELCGAAAG
jgi:orotidine-5'-phosphate decarboxylase